MINNSDTCKACIEISPDEIRQVYLDHNATTYIRPEIYNILMEHYKSDTAFGNPSTNYLLGKKAMEFIQNAKYTIAQHIGVSSNEIYFTGSGTEANNLAIKGIAFYYMEMGKRGHIITSKTEHASVLRVMENLTKYGFEITYLDVDSFGMVTADSVKNAIKKDTILVSVMMVNNEIGTINPIKKIGEVCKEQGVPLMTDGVQAFGKLKIHPKELGVSILTFSGHKIYAPKGIGGLYVNRDLPFVPIIHGGGQEAGQRSGTENVGSIRAIARATQLAYQELDKETAKYILLRDLFLEELKKSDIEHVIYGSMEYRIANNLCIGFPGVDSGALLNSLNKIGISVSAGSACSTGKNKTSHVLEAIGADTENYAAIRFSFGLNTTEDDIHYVVKYLHRILQLLR